jgi:predicted transcriptional regulator
MQHALISIHPEHVSEILAGNKTVEIRTRRTTLPAGSRLWIYATLPVGQIRAAARVKHVNYISPTRAWVDFEDGLRLTRSAFRTYVNGSSAVSAIELSGVTRLREPLSLHKIRQSASDFQPPQFFKYLPANDPLYALLETSYPRLFR